MNRSTRFRSTTPLARSALHVTITDLVAEYELRHVFRNDTADSIEAVYSFPVPLDSAFMGMEATLAGEQLIAQVVPRQQASRNYDDAIAEGDSAVLLERLEPGMLCVSLGNLKQGEEGEIVLRFAAPLPTADGTARFSLPLVHRPRYGRSKLDELDEPRHDFAAEHPLEVSIRIKGLLARAPVNCATHGARFSTDGDGQCLRLNQAMLDRDLVLVFDLPADFSAQGRLVADGEGAIGMLTFTTPKRLRVAGPCDLCLVLDGSGSMSGDAIAQSRDALRAVAGTLQEDDRIQVMRFGSHIVPLFRRPLKASARVREAMVSLVDTVNSDLGGTEMGEALDRSVDVLSAFGQASGRTQAIILVTDGAVQPHEIEDAQARAVDAGIRIFIVAVGSSAGVDVLGPLAASTRAVLERAVPAEPIDEAVMRQLRRAREAGPLQVQIDWGRQEVRSLPLDVAYPGDAVTMIAMLPAGWAFEPRVRRAPDADMLAFRLENMEEAPVLRALAGHKAWLHAKGDERAQLALRYGLITDETSAVLVKVRAEGDKAEGLPKVLPVAHMVPEGMVASRAARPPVYAVAACLAPTDFDACFYDDVPAFLRKSADLAAEEVQPEPAGEPLSPERVKQIRHALRAALDELLLADIPSGFSIRSLWDLIDPELHDDVHQYLEESSIDLWNEDDACRLLEELAEAGIGVELTDDQEARLAVWRHEAA